MHHRPNLKFRALAVVAAVLAVGACRDNPLAVQNPSNPNIASVYGTPKDVETIISKLFQQMWNGQTGAVGIGAQTMVMSFENHSALANFGMGARAAIPRGTISNALGNSNQTENFRDFDFLTRNGRSAANAIDAMNKFRIAGTSTGSFARDARARSFGYFTLGYALGSTALLYDSAAIITPLVPADEIPALSASPEVMAVALEMLDSALAISASADATTGTGGWPIPGGWVSGTDMSIARWQQVIRSYKARFRAGVARTPTERAAVNWNAVIADALGGIKADFVVNADATNGWSAAWRTQLAVDATWSQITPFIIGMADTTRAYDAWLATPLTSRVPFLIRTPDKRFPSGETRNEQQAVTGSSRAGTAVGSILYFRVRPQGDDSPAEPWGNSFYDNWRFWGIRATGGNGPQVALAVAENDMLAAEGYLRTNQVALATPLIDKTRVPAGLAPLTGVVTNATTPVPGGNSCVPRVPQPPTFTTTACGNVFEALKWEKRIETSFTGYAQWWIDSRGWGDLTENTVLEWPVPWQELYARVNLNLYTTDQKRAGKGTYGF